jgi:hypothetical protein
LPEPFRNNCGEGACEGTFKLDKPPKEKAPIYIPFTWTVFEHWGGRIVRNRHPVRRVFNYRAGNRVSIVPDASFRSPRADSVFRQQPARGAGGDSNPHVERLKPGVEQRHLAGNLRGFI